MDLKTMRRQFKLIGITISVLVMIGCTTYVNIPPQPGDVAVHDDDDDTVREVITESLRTVIQQRSIQGPVAIKLPDGRIRRHFIRTTMDTTGLIDVWPVDAQAPDDPDMTGNAIGLEVRQIRIRGWSAGVDVLMRLDPQQLHTQDQLVTVDLQWHAMHGWVVDRTRFWHRQMPPPVERNRTFLEVSQP